MATSDDKDEKLNDAQSAGGEDSSSESAATIETGDALATVSESTAIEAEGQAVEGSEDEEHVAASFGSERYVHAAFFVAGILAAFVASKTLVLGWNSLAGWPAAVRAVPQLVSFSEEQRDGYALVAGAVIGTQTINKSYRK
jgi:hypothetical protein